MKTPKTRASRSEVVFAAVCLGLTIVTYELTNWLPRSGELIILNTTLDAAIPTLPVFVIPYLSFIPIVFLLVPILLARTAGRLTIYSIAVLSAQMVMNVLYFVVPATVARPTLTGSDFFTRLLRDLVWVADNPVNTFPSNHVALSTIAALALFGLGIKQWQLVVAELWFAVIIVSTLFTNQHVLADVASGLVIGVTSYLICKRFAPSRT